jgi:hypothetical protein
MTFSIEQVPYPLSILMKSKNIWTSECPVPIESLRLLNLTHYDFENKLLSGQMIVHEKVAKNVISIFEELLKIKFPIKKISLIDNYNGDDQLSMSDNNSSCFNYRKIANSKVISMHSYGLAIDINPVQNPYIFDSKVENKLEIWPDEGKLYLNRTNQRAGMVEPIVTLFAYYGFSVWEGSWNKPLDYHHFQIDRLHLSNFL